MPHLASVASFGFADIPTARMLQIFKDVGCVTCQFYRNEHNPPVPREARKLAEDFGMPIDSIHGVFGTHYDPSSPEPSIRRAAIETYRKEGALALELGGPMVVVHPAPLEAELFNGTDAHRLQRVDPMRRSMEELAAIGQQQGVIFLIENLPGTYCFGNDPPQLATMVRELSHPNLRMCFDTGHAHMTGPVVPALRACKDVVRYLHVHDNNSRVDSHQIPGQGTIPWDDLATAIAQLPPALPAMLELFQPESEFRAQIAEGLPAKLRHWLVLK